MTEESSTPATRPMPAGLWPAFWSLAAAGFSFLAAIGAFQHEGPIAILNGGMALACACVNALLTRWQSVRRRGDEHGLARVSLTTFNLLGFAVLCAAGALVVMLSHKNRRGLDFFGDQMIWKEGVRDMALALALVFAVLGVVSWVLRQRINWSGARYALAAAVLAACTVVFGPTLTIESLQAGEIDQRSMVYKYSLVDMFNVSGEVSLRADSSLTRENDTHPVICVAQETKHFLMFGYRNARNQEPTEGAPSGEDLKRRIAQCDAEVKDALDNGRAVESVLVKGDVDRFLARMRAAPPDMQQRTLVVDIDRLPDPLKSQLTNYLPQSARLNFSAFDVALAVGNKAAAQALMPDRAGLLAHQRQGLFELGLGQSIGAAATVTEETPAESLQRNRLAAQILTQSLESGNGLSPLDTMLLMSAASGAPHPMYVGGYQDYDYYFANRHCDVDYAQFLLAQKIEPTRSHVLDLLTNVVVAQYPNIRPDPEWAMLANQTEVVGRPNEKQLPHCEALARFYAAHVQQFVTRTEANFGVTDLYNMLYSIPGSAVQEWAIRQRAGQLQTASPSDSEIHGDPAISVATAAAFLESQPPSYEQFCAWVTTAYVWTDMATGANRHITEAMRALPTHWRAAKVIYKHPDAECKAIGRYMPYDLFDGVDAHRQYIDGAAKNAGIPCHSERKRSADGSHDAQLTCTPATRSWETLDTLLP